MAWLARALRWIGSALAMIGGSVIVLGSVMHVVRAEDRLTAFWEVMDQASPWNLAGVIGLALPLTPGFACLALAAWIESRSSSR